MQPSTMQIIAVLLSPIVPVAITLWWQRRKEKLDAKRRLFITLMAHRRTFPPTIEWVNALNVIDVVFGDHTNVVTQWHRYFDELNHTQGQMRLQARERAYLDMLSAMARVLGYKRLQQTEIDMFYSPQAHQNQLELNLKTQQEFLRVLEHTSRFETSPRTTPAPTGNLSSATVPAPRRELSDIPPLGGTAND
jgi:hypothetical protein